MKTAISIPDDVFKQAEQTAAGLGLSRSELYTRAVRTYLENCGGEQMTAQLDAVYADEPSPLDEVIAQMQAQTLLSEDW